MRLLNAIGLVLAIAVTDAAAQPRAYAWLAGDGVSSRLPALSADGRVVAFATRQPLSPRDTSFDYDVYVTNVDTRTHRLISVGTHGTSNGTSGDFAISMSADARYIAFDSVSTRLILNDTNATRDIFVRDDVAGVTTRVSVHTAGHEPNGPSILAAISADGRFVAFTSDATNLVDGDVNGVRDVFVHDRSNGTTTRVSVASSGAAGNGHSGRTGVAISSDGRFVAFDSEASTLVPGDTNGYSDVFVHDRQARTTRLVSVAHPSGQADGPSYRPAISGNGTIVAFSSSATNLMPRDFNISDDVFVRDLAAGTTEFASVATSGAQGDIASGKRAVAISADGRFVTFDTDSANLGGLRGACVRDRVQKRTERRTHPNPTFSSTTNTSFGGTSLSRDGRAVAFTERRSAVDYVVVHDLSAPTDPSAVGGVLDVAGSSEFAEACILPGERYVAYTYQVSTHVLAFDRRRGVTLVVTAGPWGVPDGRTTHPRSTPDGGHLVFESWATNFVPGDTNRTSDIFVLDISGRTIRRASLSSTNAEPDDACSYPSISRGGSRVAFESRATNLDPIDNNGVADVFVRDLTVRQTLRMSVTPNGTDANDVSEHPRISGDGRFVVFDSRATNLVVGDTNQVSDIFLRDIVAGVTRRISVSSSGAQANGASTFPEISENGRFVVFHSSATNLVPAAHWPQWRVFLHDTLTGTTTCVSRDISGSVDGGASGNATISPNGVWIAFESSLPALVRDDHNLSSDVFVWNRLTGRMWRASTDPTGAEGNVGSGVGIGSGPRLVGIPVTNAGTTLFPSRASNLTGSNAEMMIVRDMFPRASVATSAGPGGNVALAFEAPGNAGLAYVAGMSTQTSPGIRVDRRTIPLAVEPLLVASLSGGSPWTGFRGTVPPTGSTTATVRIPPVQALRGTMLYVAFVVLDSASPSGIRGISNAVRIRVEP